MVGCPVELELKMNTKKEIERHRLPCGPVTVAIDGVCRRRLRDQFDSLLDRLTQETHPEGRDGEEEDVENLLEEKEETRDEKKKRLIEEGKLRAEVNAKVKQYKEKLMGNSKLLQDPSGKIEKR
jgi:hypothetical protein